MSWQATSWAQRQKTGSAGRKALLLVLANYADERGICWPSQNTIAEATEQSLDTIQRQLKKLELSGLVERTKRPGSRGRWASHVYRLNLDSDVSSPKPQIAARTKNGSGDANLRPGDAATRPPSRPQSLRPEPSIENSTEGSSRHHRNRESTPKTLPANERFPTQGQYERQLADRLGPSGYEILSTLSPGELTALCRSQCDGAVSDDMIRTLRDTHALAVRGISTMRPE